MGRVSLEFVISLRLGAARVRGNRLPAGTGKGGQLRKTLPKQGIAGESPFFSTP